MIFSKYLIYREKVKAENSVFNSMQLFNSKVINMMYVFIPFTGPLFLYLAPQNKITEMMNQKKKRNIL